MGGDVHQRGTGVVDGFFRRWLLGFQIAAAGGSHEL
jgi:hypothetical protein